MLIWICFDYVHARADGCFTYIWILRSWRKLKISLKRVIKVVRNVFGFRHSKLLNIFEVYKYCDVSVLEFGDEKVEFQFGENNGKWLKHYGFIPVLRLGYNLSDPRVPPNIQRLQTSSISTPSGRTTILHWDALNYVQCRSRFLRLFNLRFDVSYFLVAASSLVPDLSMPLFCSLQLCYSAEYHRWLMW